MGKKHFLSPSESSPSSENSVDPASNEQTITLNLNFTVHVCDDCGTNNPYKMTVCMDCGAPLTEDDGSALVLDRTDPLVRRRAEALSRLQEAYQKIRDKLQNLEVTAGLREILDEDGYPEFLSRHINEFWQRTQTAQRLISSLDYTDLPTEPSSLDAIVEEILNCYYSCLASLQQFVEVMPHPTWFTLRKTVLSAEKQALDALLTALEAIFASDFLQANELASQMQAQLDEARDTLEETRQIAFAGKQIRYGEASSLQEALASTSDEDNSILEWEKKGLLYFQDLFERNIADIPEGSGLSFAIWAVVAESGSNPQLLKERAKGVVELLRSADKVDRGKLQSVADNVQGDLAIASRHLFDIGMQAIATDFSKLGLSQQLNFAIHAYQRLSEGSFKNLLDVLIYCKRLSAKSTVPDYTELKKQDFNGKVQNLKHSKQWEVLVDIANDLVLYVRHADAHCDFYTKDGKIYINERQPRTNDLIRTHEYTEDAFAGLLHRLLYAVLAIIIGITAFFFEQHEEYPITLKASQDELLEFCKYIFALHGLIVQQTEWYIFRNTITGFALNATLAEGASLTSYDLITCLATLTEVLPEVAQLSIQISNDKDGSLRGKVELPSYPLHDLKKIDNERAKQIAYMSLNYKMLAHFSEPASLFAGQANQNTYRESLLKPTAVFLNSLLLDCYQLIQPAKPPVTDSKPPKVLDKELILLQNVLNALPPDDNAYQDQHDLALKIVQRLRQAVRRLRKTAQSKQIEQLSQDLNDIRSCIERLVLLIRLQSQLSEKHIQAG